MHPIYNVMDVLLGAEVLRNRDAYETDDSLFPSSSPSTRSRLNMGFFPETLKNTCLTAPH